MSKPEEERRRAEIYAAVKNADMEIYVRVVEIATLADPRFGGSNVSRRCMKVEVAVMSLVADLLTGRSQ
jgi:hypothetical protein